MPLNNKYYNFLVGLVKRSIQNSTFLHWFVHSPQHQNWKLPEGYNTGIKVYNVETKEKVPLVLKNENVASWYMCGPTVYAESHIGHASCYIKFDIIRRIMENMFGINVVLLMGVTDIDDKIIKKANEMNVSIQDVAKQYESDFFLDLEMLNVLPPTIISRVTENIPLIVSFCEKIIEKGYAYVTSEGNVYFSVPKIDRTEDNEQNKQLSSIDPLKKDPRDFALWKSVKPNEPWWISPWSKGRPGWHIECSAMASKVFGSELDIHSGGMDLIFPHHANEKSQSEVYHGTKNWVNYWLHSGHLHIVNDVKMSKSLGNIITIKDFLKENTANDFRILCLLSPYRSNMEYSQGCLDSAKGIHKMLHNFLNEAELYIENYEQHCAIDEIDLLSRLKHAKDVINCALADDFNAPKAISEILSFVGHLNRILQPTSNSLSSSSCIKGISSCASYIDSFLEMLGVNIICKKKLPRKVVYGINAIANFRKDVREFALKKGNVFSENDFQHNDIAKTLKIKWLDSLKSNLLAAGIELTTNEENLRWFMKQDTYSSCTAISSDVGKIMDSFLEFYQQILWCFESFSEFDIQDSNVSISNKLTKSGKRHLGSKLLKTCDAFREVLNNSNIAVKDMGHTSYWYPKENFHLY